MSNYTYYMNAGGYEGGYVRKFTPMQFTPLGMEVLKLLRVEFRGVNTKFGECDIGTLELTTDNDSRNVFTALLFNGTIEQLIREASKSTGG